MFKVPEKNRIHTGQFGTKTNEGNYGQFSWLTDDEDIRVTVICIAHDGITSKRTGWEHVSVCCYRRHPVLSGIELPMIPSWPIMCMVKNKFWDEKDVVIQFHLPPEEELFRVSSHVLHLWRNIDEKITLPPRELL